MAISATLVGAGVGLALGAGYMASGMSQAVADHGRADRIAAAASAGFSESTLQQNASATMSPADLDFARQHDPAVTVASLHLRGALGSDAEAARYVPTVAINSPTRDLDCMTQAVYFEARGETPKGQAAIAQVVMNRVKSPAFPKTVCGVVYQGAATHGCQFSFACDGSMNHVREASAWTRARRIAAQTLSGVVLADVGAATHFHTTGVSPDWGPRMLRVAQVGLHVFYRFGAPRPYAPAEPERAVFASQTTAAPAGLRLVSSITQKAADATVAPTATAAVVTAPAPADAKAVAKPAAEAVPTLAPTKTSEVTSKVASVAGPTAS